MKKLKAGTKDRKHAEARKRETKKRKRLEVAECRIREAERKRIEESVPVISVKTEEVARGSLRGDESLARSPNIAKEQWDNRIESVLSDDGTHVTLIIYENGVIQNQYEPFKLVDSPDNMPLGSICLPPEWIEFMRNSNENKMVVPKGSKGLLNFSSQQRPLRESHKAK